jgi:hypothetical protein
LTAAAQRGYCQRLNRAVCGWLFLHSLDDERLMKTTTQGKTWRAVVICLAATACEANAQELLVNGNFSTGDLTGWTFTPDAQAEATITPTVATFMGSNAFRVNAGSAVSGVEAGGVLWQTINLVAGQNYQLSAGKLAISVVNGSPNADGGTITVALGGTTLRVFDVMQIGANQTLTDAFSAPFMAAATGPAAFTVKFSRQFPNFSVTPALYHYADDLSVQAVPEPAASVLAMAAAMVLLWRRRFWPDAEPE